MTLLRVYLELIEWMVRSKKVTTTDINMYSNCTINTALLLN